MTKSIRGTSTFHCEQACDYEKEFNCRSYTYLDNPDGSVAPGGNLCLLSADNRATSHQGSMQFRPRALYAEKDCAFQKWPSQRGPFDPHMASPKPPTISQMRFHDSHGSPMSTHLEPSGDQSDQLQAQINPRNMGEEGVSKHDFNGPMGQLTDMALYQSNYTTQAQQMVDDITQMQHIPPRCGLQDFSFEKTFGYDLRYARRERAPIPSRPGVVSYCKEECLRMGDKCLAFVIEYGAKQQQNCYFLDEAANENRNQLNKLTGSSYNEKICLRGKVTSLVTKWYLNNVFLLQRKHAAKRGYLSE